MTASVKNQLVININRKAHLHEIQSCFVVEVNGRRLSGFDGLGEASIFIPWHKRLCREPPLVAPFRLEMASGRQETWFQEAGERL